MATTEHEFAFSFPAIRGIQAGREYYVAMCPFNILPKMMQMGEEELPPELRAQRELNGARIPQIARYLIENRNNYVLSSITASIDGHSVFQPIGDDPVSRKVGKLTIPLDARIFINDGQHRRAAIETALQHNSALANESVSIVFFVDAGLERSQQMFADLNRYGVRPTKSISILYDHRDPLARLIGDLVRTHHVFKGVTELAKSTISNRSRKLFTLSSVYLASCKLIQKREGDEVSAMEAQFVSEFWEEVDNQIPDWRAARENRVSPAELRRDFMHAHGIALQALALAGSALVSAEPRTWKRSIRKIRSLNWSRANAPLWEGRALIAGKVSKAHNSVVLTANTIKKILGLSLTSSEMQIEELAQKGQL